MIDINSVSMKIKTAGVNKTRIVPVEGDGFNGLQQIQIMEGSEWVTVATGMEKAIAEQIVQNATNRVICG